MPRSVPWSWVAARRRLLVVAGVRAAGKSTLIDGRPDGTVPSGRTVLMRREIRDARVLPVRLPGEAILHWSINHDEAPGSGTLELVRRAAVVCLLLVAPRPERLAAQVTKRTGGRSAAERGRRTDHYGEYDVPGWLLATHLRFLGHFEGVGLERIGLVDEDGHHRLADLPALCDAVRARYPAA